MAGLFDRWNTDWTRASTPPALRPMTQLAGILLQNIEILTFEALFYAISGAFSCWTVVIFREKWSDVATVSAGDSGRAGSS